MAMARRASRSASINMSSTLAADSSSTMLRMALSAAFTDSIAVPTAPNAATCSAEPTGHSCDALTAAAWIASAARIGRDGSGDHREQDSATEHPHGHSRP